MFGTCKYFEDRCQTEDQLSVAIDNSKKQNSSLFKEYYGKKSSFGSPGEVNILPQVIKEHDTTNLLHKKTKHPTNGAKLKETVRENLQSEIIWTEQMSNTGKNNDISISDSVPYKQLNSGGEPIVATEISTCLRPMNKLELRNKLTLLVLRWAAASGIYVEKLKRYTFSDSQRRLESTKEEERLRAIIGLLMHLQYIENYVEDEITVRLRRIVEDDLWKPRMAAALVLIVLHKANYDSNKLLLNVLLKHQSSNKLAMNANRTLRVEQIDCWIAATALGVSGYYHQAVYNYLFKLLFSRSKQVISHKKRTTNFNNIDEKCAGAMQSDQKKQPNAYLTHVARFEQLQQVSHNAFLTKLAGFVETHIIVQFVKEHTQAQAETVTRLSHRDWRARILACWLLRLSGTDLQSNQSARKHLQTIALLDSQPLLRMASYDALAGCTKSSKESDYLLGSQPSRIVCTNCHPTLGTDVDLSITQTKYTSLRTVEALYKLTAEARKPENKITILAAALCNPSSLIRKTACHLAELSSDVANQFFIRRLLGVIKQDQNIEVKTSAILALKTITPKFIENHYCSSSILEHIHQSLRNAIRDELNSDVRFELLELFLYLIAQGIIIEETNEDKIGRNIDELLDKSEAVVDERLGVSNFRVASTKPDQWVPEIELLGMETENYASAEQQCVLNPSPTAQSDDTDGISDAYLSTLNTEYRLDVDDKKPVHFELTRTYELLKMFEHSDPCPKIRRMLSTRLDAIFTKLLDEVNRKNGSSQKLTFGGDRDRIKHLVNELGSNCLKMYSDLMLPKESFYQKYSEFIKI
ncbi:unnamed protein product [Echinostoma caproni]|uniref:HEAT repeat-containing protein 6 n=1 Tax=Echinostoma caproni TaxID=27848 RepID=A0A183A6F4_9TREM|nr:unnamed protein product [Echinostoma caproni]